MNWNGRSLRWAAVLALVLIGCEDDNGPMAPRLGTIMIAAEPYTISVPWTLTGPAGHVVQHAANVTLSDRAAGTYTLTWGSIAGWDSPNPAVQTQELRAGSVLVFRGLYRANPLPPKSFAYVAPGTFTRGSPTSELGRFPDETQHTVTLTRGFYMSKFEVTEQWWSEVMGEPSTTSQLPRFWVSWDMAVQFCNALSQREGLTPAYTIHGPNGDVTWNRESNGYRLPTDAEWEYACRAGTTTAFHNDRNCLSASTEANYNGRYPITGCPTGTYRGGPTNVGVFEPNAWGLHDMHGNAAEWVWDGHRWDFESSPATDPVYDVEPGAARMLRGGSCFSHAKLCRSASRNPSYPKTLFQGGGLRPVRSAPLEQSRF